MNSLSLDGKTQPKSWAGFLRVAATHHLKTKRRIRKEVNDLIEKNDFLTACELLRNAIGRDPFVELVKTHFQVPGFQSAPIHEFLWKLDLRITITPNFDNIYDVFVGQRGSGTVTVKNYHDNDVADALRRHERVLIKSHGSVAHPDKLIFTRADYAKARNRHRDFYELLDSLLRTHTFLFVGCGLEDPDIRILLEDYCFRHEYAQKHYFVTSSNKFSKALKTVFEDSLKLCLLEYTSTPDRGHLLKGLSELVTDVERERIDLGKSQGW